MEELLQILASELGQPLPISISIGVDPAIEVAS